MATASIGLQSLRPNWREFLNRLSPNCANPECARTRTSWKLLRSRATRVQMNGASYCIDSCLDTPLFQILQQARASARRPPARHRIPLGLLLLSRQQLTIEQLRSGIEAQRRAGRGRLGEWLQDLGYVNEQQVMAAVARQWSCPMLRMDAEAVKPLSEPQIPLTLLKSFHMFPINFVAVRSTLHLAFGDSLDYSVLYAIEQMIGCRTEPCIALPSVIRNWLGTLSEQRCEREMVFDCLSLSDFARVIRSYCSRISASEVKIASCGSHIWARLLRRNRPSFDLLLSL